MKKKHGKKERKQKEKEEKQREKETGEGRGRTTEEGKQTERIKEQDTHTADDKRVRSMYC